MSLAPATCQALIDGRHDDPFAVLGVHDTDAGRLGRVILRGAETAEAFNRQGLSLGTLVQIHSDGLFEGVLTPDASGPMTYRATRADGHEWRVTDPYSFGPVHGPVDDYLINEGSHRRLYEIMGAHLIHHEGHDGFHFAVWAPNALRVSVVGDFNGWDSRTHILRHRRDTGVFEIFLPHIGAGQAYKFAITGPHGNTLPLKSDPYAFRTELRPANASVTSAPLRHNWGDRAHIDYWSGVDARTRPVSIYEVHATSWRRPWDAGYLDWDAFADQLIPYVVEMGFTHIELMPVAEYPFDGSWGYQATGLYAPTARLGDPAGLARFVDGAHQAGIGVILDWVPAHFPMDAHGLSHFDGTCLYEHEDPRLGFHPDWTTAIYNFDRREVSGFLVNNALYWAERFHIDGLRVDAVASMLYRDYSRKDGEWLANAEGGRENWEAVNFLKRVNGELAASHPNLMTIAEESTAWPGVSHPLDEGGLGFRFKWNMGFMNDSLRYVSRDPIHRSWHHDEITFGMTYAFSESFVLPISHDEVVHGKGTLLSRMPGDGPLPFAGLRAYLGLMWGHPGKKLLFMGQEFAQRREWSETRQLDWELLQAPHHAGVQAWVRDLNRLYRNEPALHERDHRADGFQWLIVDDRQNSVFAWARWGEDGKSVAVFINFSDQNLSGYEAPLPRDGVWDEVLNSDSSLYGGAGHGNLGQVIAKDGRARLTLPALSALFLKPRS